MFFNKTVALLFVTMSLLLSSISGATTSIQEEKSIHTNQESSSSDDSMMVDLNTATVDELTSLKGVGKKRAEAIVADRAEHGRFKDLEDVSRVKGISKKLISRVMSENQGRVQVRN